MEGTCWTRCRDVFGGLIAIASIALLGAPAPGAGKNVHALRPQPPPTQPIIAFLPPYFPFKPPTRPPLPPSPPSPGTPTPPMLPPNPPPPPKPPPGDDDDTPPGGGGTTPPPQAPEPSAIITAIVGSGLVGLYGIYKRRRSRRRIDG